MKLLRVLDFETTGFPPRAEVIELGYTDLVYVDATNIRIYPKASTRAKPTLPIELGALATHHIQEEDLEGCPPPEEILTGVVDQRVWAYAAHNAKFEQAFFKVSRPWICTMKCGRKLYPDAPQHTNQVLRYYLKVDKEEDFDVDYAMPPHAAGPDAYVTAFILRRMLRQHTIEDLIEWSNSPTLLSKVPFGKHKGLPWNEVPSDYLRWICGQDQAEPDVRYTAVEELKKRGVTV